MTYISITKVINNKIAKYQDFQEQVDALTHANTHSGFVYHNQENHPLDDIFIGANNTVTINTEPRVLKETKNLRNLVNKERDRRILLPKELVLSSGKSFTVDMTGESRANIDSMVGASLAKKALGLNTTISFRDADNVDHDLTNDEIIEMGLLLVQSVEQLHIKSRAIKDMETIPSDYANNSHWT